MSRQVLIKPRLDTAKQWKTRLVCRDLSYGAWSLEPPGLSFLPLTFEKETCFPHTETWSPGSLRHWEGCEKLGVGRKDIYAWAPV